MTRVGISTLVIAPPANANTLSVANSQNAEAKARAARPTVAASSEVTTTLCSPIRWARRGPTKPITAKTITGSVVMMPTIALEAWRPRCSSVSTAPTLVTATRMVSPVSTSATIISSRCQRDSRPAGRPTFVLAGVTFA